MSFKNSVTEDFIYLNNKLKELLTEKDSSVKMSGSRFTKKKLAENRL